MSPLGTWRRRVMTNINENILPTTGAETTVHKERSDEL